MPIPAFVNPDAGTAERALEALRADDRFAVREVGRTALAGALREAAARGTPRVLVSGGDGTLRAAADALAGSDTALGVLPGGTLNHFARRLGIPAEAAALDLAAEGRARVVDVGYLNDRLFLNTSSIGAYVPFVQLRDRLEDERGHGYALASVLAALRAFARFPTYRLAVRVEGDVGVYATPLLFVGVNPRDAPPSGPTAAGDEQRAGLRLVVLRHPTRFGLLRTLTYGLMRGFTALTGSRHVDSRLVETFEVNSVRRHVRAAVDGDLIHLSPPLRYRYAPAALRVVAPG